VTHKTDVGGVKLFLEDADDVRRAYDEIEQGVTEKVGAEHFHGVTVQPMLNLRDGYELIVGASPDPQFGPVLLFGTGGTLVEVFKDRSLGLPPLNSTLARRMMERTKIYEALQGVRGRESVDMELLESIMVQFSYLVAEQRLIKEIDINPLFASADQLIALDGRVLLYPQDVDVSKEAPLAIRPYPIQWVNSWTTENGIDVTFRPIRPEDEPLLVEFHRGLSEESVYMRYFQSLKFSQRVAHERLTRVAFVDFDREIALVVVRDDPETGKEKMIAAGRLSKSRDDNQGEFALLIRDDYQRLGIGTELLRQLVEIGRQEGLERIVAYMLPSNRGMITISDELGFSFKTEDGLVKASLDL
jgi:acetyltransferase